MLIEAVAIGAIVGGAYIIADHENALPWSATKDGSKKWIWEKPPFVQAPPVTTVGRATVPLSPMQIAQINQARQREIANRSSKYIITAPQTYPTPPEPYRSPQPHPY